MNGDLTVVSNLDIFEEVGRGVGHDEYIPFSVENNVLHWEGSTSSVSGNKIRIDFVKVSCQSLFHLNESNLVFSRDTKIIQKSMPFI